MVEGAGADTVPWRAGAPKTAWCPRPAARDLARARDRTYVARMMGN